jgi:hypothetical protein
MSLPNIPFGTLLSSSQVLLDQINHHREKNLAKSLHREAIELEESYHKEDVLLIKKTYLMDVFLNLEQHFQQLNAGKS